MATLKRGNYEARRVAGWSHTQEPVFAWDKVRVLGPSDVEGYYRIRMTSLGRPVVILAHESILRPLVA